MVAPAIREDSWYYASEIDTASRPPRGWSPSEVERALDAHDLGDFSMSADLARDLGRDKRVAGIRASRVNGFVGRSALPFHLEPSTEGDQRRTQTIATQVERRWWNWLPESKVRRLVQTFIDLGLAVARVDIEATTDEWKPSLVIWPMETVRWSEQDQQLQTKDRAGNKLVITPGEGWLVIGSAEDQSWLDGAVRQVGTALVERAYVTRAWLRWCEKHGNPILAISEPRTADDKTKKAEAEGFYRRLKAMSSNGVVRLPKGKEEGESWGLDMVEATGSGWQGCKAFIDKTDADIAIAYLGQNLSTEVKGGSYAATTALMTVRGDFLASDAETLSTCFRHQLVCIWGRSNVEGWTDSLAPWPTYQTTAPEPPEVQAQRQLAKAAVVKAWRDLRVDVDVLAMAKAEGLILASETLLEPTPVVKPPGPPAKDDDAPKEGTDDATTSLPTPQPHGGHRRRAEPDVGPGPEP